MATNSAAWAIVGGLTVGGIMFALQQPPQECKTDPGLSQLVKDMAARQGEDVSRELKNLIAGLEVVNKLPAKEKDAYDAIRRYHDEAEALQQARKELEKRAVELEQELQRLRKTPCLEKTAAAKIGNTGVNAVGIEIDYPSITDDPEKPLDNVIYPSPSISPN